MDIVERDMKDWGVLIGGLEVSRTSLPTYETDLTPSYVLLTGLLCRSWTSLWGEIPLEVLGNPSGDLLLI